ncbi:DUF488 family protein [Planctomycetota bacterium]
MRICTIGFRGKSAREFFGLLRTAGVEKLLDIRRRNQSQLAGFTKGRDLEYFLKACFAIEYEHVPMFAPSEELLSEYRRRLGRRKKNEAAWAFYVERFSSEVAARPIVERFGQATDRLDTVCLLCSEKAPECCHRRLVAEYVKERIKGVIIEHL